MLRTMVTLIRGRASAPAEDLADCNALLILDQQMRDAQIAFTWAPTTEPQTAIPAHQPLDQAHWKL